jgi:hypothetical protein
MDLTDPDQESVIRRLHSVSDDGFSKETPPGRILARAMGRISLFLILRTAPPSMFPNADLRNELKSLDFSSFDEVKLRSHRKAHKVG